MATNLVRFIKDCGYGTYTGTTLNVAVTSPNFGQPAQTIASSFTYAIATLKWQIHILNTSTYYGGAVAECSYIYTGGVWTVSNTLYSGCSGIISSFASAVTTTTLRAVATTGVSLSAAPHTWCVDGMVSYYA